MQEGNAERGPSDPFAAKHPRDRTSEREQPRNTKQDVIGFEARNEPIPNEKRATKAACSGDREDHTYFSSGGAHITAGESCRDRTHRAERNERRTEEQQRAQEWTDARPEILRGRQYGPASERRERQRDARHRTTTFSVFTVGRRSTSTPPKKYPVAKAPGSRQATRTTQTG